MKFRRDITNYLKEYDPKRFKLYTYKIYEQNNILYMAEYRDDLTEIKITNYGEYTLLWHDDDKKIKSEIEEKFNVKFSDSDVDIVCKCGESKYFSAYYASYQIILRCNTCKNEFSAYSG